MSALPGVRGSGMRGVASTAKTLSPSHLSTSGTLATVLTLIAAPRGPFTITMFSPVVSCTPTQMAETQRGSRHTARFLLGRGGALGLAHTVSPNSTSLP